jgi:hypothetical protein
MEAAPVLGLDATAFDWSPYNLNSENRQITSDARYSGPILGWPQDGLAVGFVYTHIGDPLQSAGIPGMLVYGWGKAIKLHYSAQINRTRVLAARISILLGRRLERSHILTRPSSDFGQSGLLIKEAECTHEKPRGRITQHRWKIV